MINSMGRWDRVPRAYATTLLIAAVALIAFVVVGRVASTGGK